MEKWLGKKTHIKTHLLSSADTRFVFSQHACLSDIKLGGGGCFTSQAKRVV